MSFNSEKLSLKSSVFIAISSMVGAGIFIKTQTINSLSHSSILPVLVLFVIFLVNVFAFSYVLIKIIPSQTGNMGFMEWSKTFCPSSLNSCFVNFIRYFYHPVSLVLFSIYGIRGVVGNQHMGLWTTLFLSFVVVFTLMLINLLSFKWAHKIQLILWFLILIPLILLPFIGMISTPMDPHILHPPSASKAKGLDSLGPWLLLVSGLPSVLFIYDGFYSLASLKDRMASSSKLGLALVISFALVTLLYLYVIIGFYLGDPVSADYKNFSFLKRRVVIAEIFEILIGCAAFLTLNSIALTNIPQLKAINDVYRHRDIESIRRTLFYKDTPDEDFESRFVVWIYLMVKTTVWFLVIGIIGVIMESYSGDSFMVIIDSLADIVSVFVFIILVSVILGSLGKRFAIKKDFKFRLSVAISSLLIISALIYLLISYVVGTTGFAGANPFSSWVKLILLVLFFVGSSIHIPIGFIDKKIHKKKYILYPEYHKGSIIVTK